MADSYLLLTPLLMLGVFALVRFIGCHLIFKLDPVHLVPRPPDGLTATAGNHAVELTWQPSPDGGPYRVKSGETAGGPYPTSHDTTDTFFSDTGLTNGITVFYVVVAVGETDESDPSNEASATPAQGLVTSSVTGTLRNDFTGVAGALIRVAASPLFAVGLGRMFFQGNTGAHAMKIVDASTNVDVPNAATMVDLTSPTAQAGTFVYGLFPSPVMLNPNTEYYIVSAETSGGDRFADLDTTVFTTGDAAVVSAVFGDGISSYTRGGGAGNTYGPVDLIF